MVIFRRTQRIYSLVSLGTIIGSSCRQIWPGTIINNSLSSSLTLALSSLASFTLPLSASMSSDVEKDYIIRDYRLLPVEWLHNIWRPDSFFKNAKQVLILINMIYMIILIIIIVMVMIIVVVTNAKHNVILMIRKQWSSRSWWLWWSW